MPVLVETPSLVTPPHKLWTREECAALERAEVLDLARYELIHGELVEKMGKKSPHMRAVMRLVIWLRRIYGEALVAQEPSISVHPEDSPKSEPEPDVIVLTRSFLELDSLARPDQIRFIAEVSGATLAFDLTVKSGLYARAGIAEYWVLDLEGRRVIVHRKPENGQYQEVAGYLEDELVATLGAPDVTIRVGELL